MTAVLANVLIPHLALTVALRSYMPGTATAVALNLPVLSLLVVLSSSGKGTFPAVKAAAYSVGMACHASGVHSNTLQNR
jgi:hypothetical protein